MMKPPRATLALIGLAAWALALALVVPPASASDLTFEEITKRAEAISDWIVELRRELHKTPEPGFQEFNTTSIIRRVLDEHGIPYKQPYATTGIVATIGSGQPIVALRADMDALPILEPEGPYGFRSKNDGWMHACGHDGHMSMLLGAAKLLKQAHEQGQMPAGSVRLVFQPAEEGGAGGEIVVDQGALDGVGAAFGFHVMPHIPSGVAATRGGTIMAGALSFRVTVAGRGGHAAMPHLNVDPVVAAAGLISALQTLVSRETSPLGSAVLSVTMLRAGDAYNVIPDEAMFGGTIRALTHEHLMYLKGRMEQMAPALAAGYGCNATVDWRLDEQPYYPPTVNDDAMAEFAKETAASLFGPERVQPTEPLMAGEDFAFFCRKVPCAFVFLGIRNEALGSVHALHNPKFQLDEAVLPQGSALHTALALEYLRTAQQQQQGGRRDEL